MNPETSNNGSLQHWKHENGHLIESLLQELEEWPGPVVKRHNDAKLLYHKLVFLAELGMTVNEPAMERVAGKILEQPSPDGPFHLPMNIPTVFGGTGRDEPLWMLCDAPLVTYALVRMGLRDEPKVERSVDYLLSLMRVSGWPCAAASALGRKFKGPGKQTDPCPYANLIMLRLLTALPERIDSREARNGCTVLLDLWEHRKEVKYFLFGMGNDFRKLKAPFIWYDILHVTEVLTQFPFLKGDRRLEEMIGIISEKRNPVGSFQAESVYRAWKEWDFGQKKEPSPWITLMSHRILNRWDRMNKAVRKRNGH